MKAGFSPLVLALVEWDPGDFNLLMRRDVRWRKFLLLRPVCLSIGIPVALHQKLVKPLIVSNAIHSPHDLPFMTSRRSPIGIAIVVKDDPKGLERLLHGLTRSFALHHANPASSTSLSWPILVIDNASLCKLNLAGLVKHFPHLDLQLFRRERNHMGEARQNAIEGLDTEWLVFLDSDCLVPRHWCDKIQRRLESIVEFQPNCAAIGGVSHNRGAGWFNRAVRILGLGFAVHRQESSALRDVNHLPTCHVCYRRDVLSSLGGFSPHFPRVGEDLELSYRLRAHGWRLTLDSSLQVAHQQTPQFGSWLARMNRYGQAQTRVARIYRSHWYSRQLLPLNTALAGLLLGVTSVLANSSWLTALILAPFAVILSMTTLALAGFVFTQPLPGLIGDLHRFCLFTVFAIASTLSYALGSVFGLLTPVPAWPETSIATSHLDHLPKKVR